MPGKPRSQSIKLEMRENLDCPEKSGDFFSSLNFSNFHCFHSLIVDENARSFTWLAPELVGNM